MTTYYYEKHGFEEGGTLEAESDDEAHAMMPDDCMVLYRDHEESPTEFIVVYEDSP